jgi:16S rRNA (guanine(527)-N(7))-methyltransferase RsmG
MIDSKLDIWINEIRRFNKALHLVGPKVYDSLEDEALKCITLMQHIREPEIADLGSGSGIPGIAYAAINPQSKVWLIDRSEKKCTFLRHVISICGFDNARVLHVDPLVDTMDKYKAVISRAFSPVEKLSDALASIMEDKAVVYYMSIDAPKLDGRFLPAEGLLSITSKDLKIFSYRFSP